MALTARRPVSGSQPASVYPRLLAAGDQSCLSRFLAAAGLRKTTSGKNAERHLELPCVRPDPCSSKTGLPAPCSTQRARRRARSRPRATPWCDARGGRRPRSQASEFVGPKDADVDADPRRKNHPRLSEKWKQKGAASGVSVPRTRESERGPRGTPFKGGINHSRGGYTIQWWRRCLTHRSR